MSSEGENAKNKELEVNDAKSEDATDGAKKEEPVVKDAKAEAKDEKNDAGESEDEKKEVNDKKEDEAKKDVDKVDKKEKKDDKKDKKDDKKDKKDDKKEKKDDKKDKKDDVKNDVSKESDSEKDDDKNDVDDEEDDEEEVEEDEDEDEKVDKKEKKKPQKQDKEKADENEKDGKTEIPEGSGTELGEIPRIDASISRFKTEDLKLLHRLLFTTPGKANLIKKNIRKFNGFDFDKDSDEYEKKLAGIDKFELKQLRIICEMLDLDKKGNKDDISGRILEFLIEPKDSGNAVGRGRPKRTAAVRANNRGYSSHDESYSSDERHTPRARRNMGKRANLKDDTSSGSDEDFQPSDNSEDEKPAKRKRGAPRKKKDESEDEASDADSGSSDDSDARAKKKKVANNKPKAKTPVGTPGRRGRKPAAAAPSTAPKKKATPAKRGRKPAHESSEESADAHDDGSSSEDEPLAKKAAKNPPTDEEIKTYVKEILEGADLELITMKTVCKQVYANYPEFDLTHKKDYIKTTVKSLIST